MPEYKKIGYLTSSFKVFHLKDWESREHSYHYHDFHKILILLSGDVTYNVDGRSYELLSGDIVLIRAGSVHRPIIRTEGLYERIIIYISPEYLDGYREEDNDLTLCFQRAAAEQSHVLRLSPASNHTLRQSIQTLDNSRKDTDYCSSLHKELSFLNFMLQLNRAALHKGLEFIENSPSNDKIIDILNYLDAHLTEDISIEDLSARFYLSRYYLMHVFKQQTGYSIFSYLSSKRLILAQRLLKEEQPATEVCYACGFKTYSSFFRAYKKHFGESPRAIRQNTD